MNPVTREKEREKERKSKRERNEAKGRRREGGSYGGGRNRWHGKGKRGRGCRGTSLAVASSASDEWRALARLLFAIRCDCQPGDSDDVVRRRGTTRGGLGRIGERSRKGGRARVTGRGQKRPAGVENTGEGWMERAWVRIIELRYT